MKARRQWADCALRRWHYAQSLPVSIDHADHNNVLDSNAEKSMLVEHMAMIGPDNHINGSAITEVRVLHACKCAMQLSGTWGCSLGRAEPDPAA